tara:strand:+ start:60 stop:830 length:771 start_codon:yes stop_codon:yes gene_type:complete
MKKYHFIFDKTNKNKEIKNFFIKKYKNYSAEKCSCIIVSGGDGFMLKILKKYQKLNKPFYGINGGTIGFLMNKFKSNDLEKRISKSRVFTILPLQMKATTRNNKTISAIAINEISLLRQSRQTACLQILNKNKTIIKKLVSDGVLVSTPAGSTAYNLSVNGPILSLNSKKLAITPISPFRPRRWKGKIVSSSAKIKIINLDNEKRSISAVADNIEVRNVKNVTINVNNQIKFKLLYDKSNSLIKKINLEQSLKKRN